jgi:hypothetical protein
MAGSRGPVPKRSDQRRRHSPSDALTVNAEAAAEVEVPPADEAWHPVARRWFESLAESGQSAFYEPSDWATAQLLAESMSRDLLTGEPVRGAALAAWLKGMSSLLVTEGDRRRVQVELIRPSGEEGDADVSELAEYRRRLQSS